MRYSATSHAGLGETRIELNSNTYTDALPMLKRISFRKQVIDLNSQSLALATAVLTGDYCSEVFDFVGLRIGNDYAAALRQILGPDVSISNVDGMNRAFSTGEMDMAVGQAGEPQPQPCVTDLPLARFDWSGDFVSPATRSSRKFVFGAVQTNALYFADPTRVSIAVGLILGRDRLRNLFVPAPETRSKRFEAIQEGLRIVGIRLELVGA